MGKKGNVVVGKSDAAKPGEPPPASRRLAEPRTATYTNKLTFHSMKNVQLKHATLEGLRGRDAASRLCSPTGIFPPSLLPSRLPPPPPTLPSPSFPPSLSNAQTHMAFRST
ncbi:hypothetical protein E2C01_053208 [Portunus trituberculatus]|uniref:Uncharacterized protein n=1 Tax=Portunus trituberculatus TaxID=210409 RepID=A0A5B7GJN6_PORTR|nr:hypothetical protein [Portunus trituberculatus]